MIVAISGTPGTGKSLVGRLLEKRTGWDLIELNSLAEEKNLYCGYDRERKTKIVDTGRIKRSLPRRENLIVVSHYAHDIPNDLTVVLRCEPGELRERMKRRGWPREKIEENIQAEIMEVCLEEAHDLGRRVLEIDSSGKQAEEVVEEILREIKL